MTVDSIRQHALLYSSFALACLEDRSWSFAIWLVLNNLGGMQLVSFEQFVEGIFQIFMSARLGNYLDSIGRKKAITISVVGNNLSIVLSSLLFAFCLAVQHTWIYAILLILGMIFCSLYRVFVIAEKNIESKDWVLVLTDEKHLARTNAITNAIYQISNIIAPIMTGFLLANLSMRTSCIAVSVFAICSFLAKASLLSMLYKSNKELQACEHEEDCVREPVKGFFSFLRLDLIRDYYSQRVCPAAFGLALLYMTVLGFDGVAIGYGHSAGLSKSLLGGFRSFASAVGLLGAISYAILEGIFGVRKTGIIGFAAQDICLFLAVASVFLPGSPFLPMSYFSTLTWNTWRDELIGSFSPVNSTVAQNAASYPIDWDTFSVNGTSIYSIIAFLVAISSARFGLWIADLSVTQIMQLSIPESERNTIFGTQNSICNILSMIKDLLVVILPDPATFGICIFISYGFTVSGFVMYLYYLSKPKCSHEAVDAGTASEESVKCKKRLPSEGTTEERTILTSN